MDQGEGEFSIYEAWMRGEYRDMVHVPHIDNYRILNKGHFVTRCKYNILRKTIALAGGDCNINLIKFVPISNWDLFCRSYPKEEA